MSNYRRYLELEEGGIDLVELLSGDRSLDSQEFLSILGKVQDADDQLYPDLLFVLTHRRFGVSQAKQLWHGILKHKRKLSTALGRNPGVRIAALDYLTNVREIMKRPRIVDREDFKELLCYINVDDLTGLYNRRHIMKAFQREIRRARRYSKALTVMLIDVDNFKQINDSYGHAAGDRALVELAELLREICRETDTIGRYGGDEILVLLPETKKSDAYSLAERIRRAAHDREFHADPEKTRRLRFSLSIGLATYPDDSQESAELLSFADEALYTSKNRGRDAVSLYEQDNSRASRESLDPSRDGI